MEVERGKTTTNNIYKSVCKKVENFFYEENYLNIDSAIIFRY